MDMGTGIQESSQGFGVTAKSSLHQGGLTPLILCIDIGPGKPILGRIMSPTRRDILTG